MRREIKPSRAAVECAVTLSDPGMARPHRVGLAGLWSVLRSFEQLGTRIEGVTWHRDPNGVVLRFETGIRDGLAQLAKEAFKTTTDGLVWIASLGNPDDDPVRAVLLQDALLCTFLQHGKSRRADPSKSPGGSAVAEVEGSHRGIVYRRVFSFKHQEPPWKDDESLEVTNWLLPGGAERHTAFGGRTRLVDPFPRSVCLLFLPAGVYYYRIQQVGRKGSSLEIAVILADPRPGCLGQVDLIRQNYVRMGVEGLVVAGPGEAEMSLMGAAHGVGAWGAFADVEVWSFGKSAWARQQYYRTRVDTHSIGPGIASLFVRSRAYFAPASRRVLEDGELAWRVPQMPELIASNMAEGRPWWEGFARFILDRDRGDAIMGYERDRRGKIVRTTRGERGGVAGMLRDCELFPEGPERVFVEAVQEAWRRRLGQLGEVARERGTEFSDLATRESERWRIAFSRCRNEAGIREVVADFLSRASSGGSLPQLQGGGIGAVLDVCRDWKKARDLALLALAGYTGSVSEGADTGSGQQDTEDAGSREGDEA
jgi:CRISPR-associated protein Cas8a1/Csx13